MCSGDICGTCYQGAAAADLGRPACGRARADSDSKADAAHKQFKIHNSYQDRQIKSQQSATAPARLVLIQFMTLRSWKEIRNKLDALKPRVDEWRKSRQDQDTAKLLNIDKYISNCIYIYTHIFYVYIKVHSFSCSD